MSSAAVVAAIVSRWWRDYKPIPYPHKHYLVLWILFGWVLLWIPVFYITFSHRHYWVCGPFCLCRTYEPKGKRPPKVVRKGDQKGKGVDAILLWLVSWPFLFIPMIFVDVSSKYYCYLGVRQKNGSVKYLNKVTRTIIYIYLVLLTIGAMRFLIT